MQIDYNYTDAEIRQFSGELGKFPHSIIIELEQLFEGDKSAEFYRGLLAGYANALSIAQNKTPQGTVGALTQLVAFIADRIVRLEA